MGPNPLAAWRLHTLVRHAREDSPFFARRYAHLPPSPSLEDLPATRKDDLMERFDDWCTDREVTRAAAERFMADRTRIGDAFLGRYGLWKSSGTSGTPGIFVQDAHAMAVYDSLVYSHLDGSALARGGLARLMRHSGRAALVVATGDHFASIGSWQRQSRLMPGVERRAFPVTWAIARLARALEEFDPAFLASYPSMLRLLAQEREAGRLAITPALLWSGGETLTGASRKHLERAFGCRVMNEYGSSECLTMACECEEGWLHASSDWVILEPVDEHGAPTPAGKLSHTLLVTNLANHVQPVIRYDIGDRMLVAPRRCACGSARPAFRIAGRSDAMVDLRAKSGAHVRIAPLALATVVEEAGVDQRFQIAQVEADALTLRLDGPVGPAWRLARPALRDYLAAQGLPDIKLRLDRAAPRLDRGSGKLRAVVVEAGKSPRLDVSQRPAAGSS